MHVKSGLCGLAFLMTAGCGAAGAISDAVTGNPGASSPSGGVASLQTAPFDPTGKPSHVSPAPAPQTPETPAQADAVPDFTSVAANFDPNVQHFVWVLPPGVHGVGPWGFSAEVRHKGAVKFETELPLVAETLAGGSRPEYPAGYEVIRLTDDGGWANRTAEMDTVIRGIIAEHGPGDGEVEFSNLLTLSLEPDAKRLYCEEGKAPDIRLFVEEKGQAELIPMMEVANETFARMAVAHACK